MLQTGQISVQNLTYGIHLKTFRRKDKTAASTPITWAFLHIRRGTWFLSCYTSIVGPHDQCKVIYIFSLPLFNRHPAVSKLSCFRRLHLQIVAVFVILWLRPIDPVFFPWFCVRIQYFEVHVTLPISFQHYFQNTNRLFRSKMFLG